TLTGREPLRLGVGRALDVDRVGRAGPCAQLAADALLQPVRVAVEYVPAVIARRGDRVLERVLRRDHLAEQVGERDPEPLGRTDDAHVSPSPRARPRSRPR